MVTRNAFADALRWLDKLPDSAAVGAKLIAGGALELGGVNWWGHRQAGFAGSEFEFYLELAGAAAVLSGAFIFFRRGVWWWQERREKKEIPRINLK